MHLSEVGSEPAKRRMNAPKQVFVGMPLYNNARTLERALDSVLRQTEPRFRVVLSDDGSTDETVTIARNYAARDGRLSVVVQPKNLNYGNFRYLLSMADTPFVVFLAGDDAWEPTFLESCLRVLEHEPEVVCAVSRVRFEAPDGSGFVGTSTASLDGPVASRLSRYIQNPSDNSRIYGVFRTEVAKRAFPAADFFAYDWYFSAATLLAGSHREIPEILMHRELTPPDAYVRYVRRDNKSSLSRFLPILPLTWGLLRRPDAPRSWPVLRALLKQNLEYHLKYAKAYLPRWYALTSPLLNRIYWRLERV